MAQKTYYQLKYEDRHLEVDDALLIHGVNYTVHRSGFTDAYFLNNKGGENCEVFNIFGLDMDEKYSWAKKFNSTGVGGFPEFKDIKDLERFVIDIYERPEYKVGDYVTILERKHNPNAYPASFVDDMASQCGKTFQISGVHPEATSMETYAELHNGEPNLYTLKGIGYLWHPSMFRKATESEIEVCNKSTFEIKVDAGVDTSKACQCSGSSSSAASSLEDSITTLNRMMKVAQSLKSYSLGEPADLRDTKLRLPKDINKTPHINL